MDTAYAFLPPNKKAGNSRLLIIHCCGVAAAGVSCNFVDMGGHYSVSTSGHPKVWMMLNSLYGDVFFVDMHWLVIIEIDEGSGIRLRECSVGWGGWSLGT